jgi:hypothetical protein
MVTGCCMHLRLGSHEDSDRHGKKIEAADRAELQVAAALSRSRGSTGTPVHLS